MAPTVALLSPGAMGAVVGRVLGQHGARVITSLHGRSAASAERARDAGIEPVDSDTELVEAADFLLAILVPAEVVPLAHRVAAALKATDTHLVYVDCNAVAPATGRQVADIVTEAGARAVDAGIIGPPPTRAGVTRFYASGEHADELAALGDYGLDVRLLGPDIGQASAFKMCYAAQTKGRYAIFLESLITASRLGLYDALVAELQTSQRATYDDTERSLPGIPAKSGRWIGEMEEIAATFDAVGLPPAMFTGAAEVYRYVTETDTDVDAGSEDDGPARLRRLVEALAARLA